MKINQKLTVWVLLYLLVFHSNLYSQITYGPLYKDNTFIKSIDISKPVGVTEGVLDVDLIGAATYTIPISVPPGTKKIQPQISINYNSQSGNGNVGWGWNIGGMSAIVRTAKDQYLDDEVDAVKFANDDAFSLDGQRLYLNSGSYGTNGATYNIEQIDFSTITSNGTIGNGPSSFTVVTKEGNILEYGNSSDSKLLTNNGTTNVMFWRLNKMKDPHGNYIEYIYDNTDRDSRISQIKYTGNDNTGMLPFNTIDFVYNSRFDDNTIYEGGSSVGFKYLLEKIIVKAEGQNVRQYVFKYGKDDLYSYLIEVIENGTDFSPSKSLNSTIFKYGDLGDQFTSNQLVVNGLNGLNQYAGNSLYSGDFDGDGKSDILVKKNVVNGSSVNEELKIYKQNVSNGAFDEIANYSSQITAISLENTKGSGNNLRIPKINQSFSYSLTSDFNGDKKQDLFLSKIQPGGGSIFNLQSLSILTYNPSSGGGSVPLFENPLTLPTNGFNELDNVNGDFRYIGDFDGDGRSDAIIISSKSITTNSPPFNQRIHEATLYSATENYFPKTILGLQLNGTGTSSSDITNLSPQIIPTLNADFETLDINGDGKSELLVKTTTGSEYFDLKKNSNGDYVATGHTISDLLFESHIYSGDFNGDGKSDLLTYHYIDGWELRISNGNSFITHPINILPLAPNFTSYHGNGGTTYYEDKFLVGDFNGDGKSDILQMKACISQPIQIYYCNGEDFINSTIAAGQVGDILGCQSNTSPFGFPSNPLILADLNGDGKHDILYKNTNSTNPISNLILNNHQESNLLKGVIDGFNRKNEIDYKLITSDDVNFYEPGGIPPVTNSNFNTNYPISHFQPSIFAVKEIYTPDGIGGNNRIEYKYKFAQSSIHGRGFLGFTEIHKTNTDFNTTTKYTFLTQSNYFVPQNTKIENFLNGQLTDQTFLSYSFQNYGGKKFVKRVDVKTEYNALQGFSHKISNLSYDYWSNPLQVKDEIYQSIGNTIEQTNSSFVYGPNSNGVNTFLLSAQIIKSRLTEPSVTIQNDFSYNGYGDLIQKKEFANLPNPITTDFGITLHGNIASSIVGAASMASRKTQYTYDSKGRFIIAKENSTIPYQSSLVWQETVSYDARFGVPLYETSSNCINTSYSYDEYGRNTSVTPKYGTPEQYSITKSMNFYIGNDPRYRYYTNINHPAEPFSTTFYDILGRQTWEIQGAPNGNSTTSISEYDNRGNIVSQTTPYLSSEIPLVTTNTFDNFNRIISSVSPLKNENYTYNYSTGNLEIGFSNSSGQITNKIIDPAGKTINTTDKGGTLMFKYDSWGNEIETMKSSTVLVSQTFNQYNRLIAYNDVNAGNTDYTYNNFGELINKKDASGALHNYFYDASGRLTSKVEPEGTIEYTFGSSSCDKSYLLNVQNYNGDVEQFNYDAFGRVISKSLTIDGKPFDESISYDKYDKMLSTQYPSGISITNDYDADGYFTKTYCDIGGVVTDLYTKGDYNGYGQPKSYSLGNGSNIQKSYDFGFLTSHDISGSVNQSFSYTYDYLRGNMMSREDGILGLQETFSYDLLDRLVSSSINGSTTTYQYDGSNNSSLGNVAFKSDIGYFGYQLSKKHAITFASQPDPNTPVGVVGPYILPNVISDIQQDISYTSFKRPSMITEGDWVEEFRYGSNFNRNKSVLTDNSGSTETVTKYYLGNYEERITPSGGTDKLHYVYGEDGLCAIIVMDENGNAKIHYTYTDHLGSIVKVTDEGGTVEAEQNFDVWGRNRNPQDWTYDNVPDVPHWLYRGYTGHEMIPQFSLINMNARLYDPIVGRMLTPDEHLKNPESTQSYNRYSYANNNPLKFTDPSGKVAHIIIGALIGGCINLVIQSANGKVKDWSTGITAFGVGALAGGVGAATGGASLVASGMAGGIIGGAGSGFISGATSGLILTTGNAVFLGDYDKNRPIGEQIIKGTLMSAITGGIIGGGIGYFSTMNNPQVDKWTGNLIREEYELHSIKMIPYPQNNTEGIKMTPYELGQEGLRINNITQNNIRIPSYTRTASYRVPDELIEYEGRIQQIGEVKHYIITRTVRYTNQIRDFISYAEYNQIPFKLYIPRYVTPTSDLLNAINSSQYSTLIKY